MRNRVSKAFTLVEILIVVVILGILAAIVIPQFTNASQEAQTGNIKSQLQTLRSQIELFRVRNNGSLPVLVGANDASFADFLVQTPAGASSPVNSLGRTQDAYARSRPINPRNGRNEVATSSATGPAFVTAAQAANAASGPGWLYNPTTGEFAAQGFNETTGAWN